MADGDAELSRVSEEQGEDGSDVQDAQDDEDEQDLFVVGDSELQLGQTFSDITRVRAVTKASLLNAFTVIYCSLSCLLNASRT